MISFERKMFTFFFVDLFEFDATGNALLIKKGALKNYTQKMNRFMITTFYLNRTFSHYLTIEVDKSISIVPILSLR